ncbi:MAG: invasion associated locus B family protein [Siculibacillus sp.]|nr:invasion associated locus B family protein [Siculibacillus sp.]
MRISPLSRMVAVLLVASTGPALAQTKPAPTPAKPTPAAAKPAQPAQAPQPAASAPAPAGSPMLVMESKDWKVVTANSAKGKVCFAMTKPTKMEPANLKHGDVFFFVSTRPAEKVRNEPSLQFGYPLKEGSPVVIDIDGKKYDFFTRGDGAWFEKSTEYAAFLETLKKGKKMTAAGASARGNPTSYVFSLAGVSAAIDGAAKECK